MAFIGMMPCLLIITIDQLSSPKLVTEWIFLADGVTKDENGVTSVEATPPPQQSLHNVTKPARKRARPRYQSGRQRGRQRGVRRCANVLRASGACTRCGGGAEFVEGRPVRSLCSCLQLAMRTPILDSIRSNFLSALPIIFLSGPLSRITETMTKISLTWEMVGAFVSHETFGVKPETFVL